MDITEVKPYCGLRCYHLLSFMLSLCYHLYMKQIIIRVDDELAERLSLLPNKTKYITEAIIEKLDGQKQTIVNQLTEARVIELIQQYTPKQFAPTSNTASSTFIPSAPDPETGYPCCTKKNPCKHWVFDGTKGAYVNSLTGKTKSLLDEIDIADL